MQNDAINAYNNAIAKTARGQEHKEPRHNLQIICHIKNEEEAYKNQLMDMGIFKPTSGNAIKRPKIKQEMYKTIKTAQIVEATLKQIATRKFQVEKEKM